MSALNRIDLGRDRAVATGKRLRPFVPLAAAVATWISAAAPCGLSADELGAEVEYPAREHYRLLRTWSGTSRTETMGFKIRDVGDLDGDGVRDFAMAATGRDNGSLERAGAIDVYSTASGRLLHSVPGHFSPGSFGNGIGFAGDVDGDGAGDVVAGSYDRAGSQTGYALVFTASNGMTLRVLRSGKTGDQFGIQAHGVGDLDRDGYDDLVVAAPTDDSAGPAAGRAYFFSGHTGEVLFTLEGDAPGDEFASGVTGDVYDRSGLFAIGAREAGPGHRGRVYIYRMIDGKPVRLFTVEPLASSHELGAYFLSFLGDVDADGTPDLYAGDYADDAHGEESGRVHVLSGRTGERLLELEGRSEWGGLGTGYGRVGDVDGDGHADILAGSWRNNDGAEAGGAAFLYSGSDGRLLACFTGRFPGRTFGHDAIGIGDVDGDGLIDLLITNAGNSGVQPREIGHVYLFSGAGLLDSRDAAPSRTAVMR